MFITNHQKPLQMKPEKNDKVFSRVLSKEANPSFRVYYGGLPANVPFMWESQPGTPKHNFFKDEALPPLTPPPSYFSKNPNKKPSKNNTSSSNLLRFLLLKLSLKKKHIPKSPSSATSSSSSFSSLFSSKSDLSMREPMTSCRSRFSSACSSFDYRGDYEEEGVVGSLTSTLCFRIGGKMRAAKRVDDGHRF